MLQVDLQPHNSSALF